MNILQRNKVESPDNLPIFIYLKQESRRVRNNKYISFQEECENYRTDDLDIEPSFHLSKSNRTEYEYGFTNQPNEIIEYSPVDSVLELLSIFQKDCSGTLFKNNYRGLRNYIQSDVLCFDIDNDDETKDSFWDDESNWITIDGFSKMFQDYTFILSTSRNHMKEKKGRSPRPRFHVFLPLESVVTDKFQHQEMLDMIVYHTMKDGRSRIDTSVGVHSQIFGNSNTEIYFNSGKDKTTWDDEYIGEGSIDELLHKDNFREDYRRYTDTAKKSRPNRQGKTDGDFTDIESLRNHCLEDWDYRNIISKYPLEHWYEGLTYQNTNRDYLMSHCGLPNHKDNSPSLMVFPSNGGFNCLGCGESHKTPLVYIGLKTNRDSHDVRLEYCDKLGLDVNDFYKWLDSKKSSTTPEPNENTTREDSMSVSDDNNDSGVIPESGLPDPFPHQLTTSGDAFVSEETYQELVKMNHGHSLIYQSGKVSMMTRERTRHSPFKTNQFPSMSDFKLVWSNQRHRIKNVSPTGKETEGFKDLGSLWELWKDRRQYEGIDFNPTDEREDYYDDRIWDMWDDWESGTPENDWKGDITRRGLPKFMNMDTLNIITTDRVFTDYIQGCNKYLEHIQRVICGNYDGSVHTQLLDYVLGWMTKCVTQHGRNRVKVALVLLGGQGSGKGTMISNFGEIFGQHFLHVGSMDRVTNPSGFNLHMMDKVLVYINECLFGGDKKSMNVMKYMITEDTMEVEGKYMNSFTGKSNLKFMISSNEDFVVPVEHDGRRYMIVDISNEFVGKDSDWYFTPLFDQWNDGGKENFYKFITNDRMIDKSNEINYITDRPQTTGRSDQLLQTEPLLAYFHSLLIRGGHRVRDSQSRGWSVLKWSETDDNRIYLTDQIYEDYHDFCRSQKIGKFIQTKNQLGKELVQKSKYIEGFDSKRCNPKSTIRENPTGQTTYWKFGSLESMRENWVDTIFGGDEKSAWGEYEDDDNSSGYTPQSFDINNPSNFSRPDFSKKDTD